jgi:hypothetical protein
MRKKVNIKILILIGVLSIFTIPSSYAIFKSYAFSSEELSSAEWVVSLEQDGINNDITVLNNSTPVAYTLKVKSLSEVDAIYSVIVSNLPSGVEVAIGDGQFQTPVNNKVTFPDVGIIRYADSIENKTKTHTLYFRAGSGATIVSNRQIDVDVDIKQLATSAS